MKISLPTLLFVVFLVLKLCGVIAWSWWWVTAPLWVGWGIGLVFAFCLTLLAFLASRKRQLPDLRRRVDDVFNVFERGR